MVPKGHLHPPQRRQPRPLQEVLRFPGNSFLSLSLSLSLYIYIYIYIYIYMCIYIYIYIYYSYHHSCKYYVYDRVLRVSGSQSYISKGIWRQGNRLFCKEILGFDTVPVVTCPGALPGLLSDIYIYIYIYIHTYTRIYLSLSPSLSLYIYIYTCMYMYLSLSIYLSLSLSLSLSIYIYICICIYTYIYICKYNISSQDRGASFVQLTQGTAKAHKQS